MILRRIEGYAWSEIASEFDLSNHAASEHRRNCVSRDSAKLMDRQSRRQSTHVISEDEKRIAAQLGNAVCGVLDAIGRKKRNGLEGASPKPFPIN